MRVEESALKALAELDNSELDRVSVYDVEDRGISCRDYRLYMDDTDVGNAFGFKET